MKCGPGFKKGIGFKQYGGTDRKYLIANGVLQVAAPTVRRKCSYEPLKEYWQYISTTQGANTGFYQLNATTSQAYQNATIFNAFFYFLGIDITKYKKMVIKTKGVTANANGTYIVSAVSGIIATLFTEANDTNMPAINPFSYHTTSTGEVTVEYDISALTGGYVGLRLAPNYQAPVTVNIVDLYLIEK